VRKIILIALSVASTLAYAQTKKIINPTFTPVQTNYSSAENNVTALLGFDRTAANIGIDYVRMSDSVGFGGYFGLQTEKKSAGINQVMTFGGLMKFNIAEKSKFVASMSPGFGIHMFKDVGTSDETAFGLVFKIAAQYKLTQQFALGVQSTTITNMFSDKAPSGGTLYALAGSFNF
jgi:hypothetical protein